MTSLKLLRQPTFGVLLVSVLGAASSCKPEPALESNSCVVSDLATVDCSFTVVTTDPAQKSFTTTGDLVPYLCGGTDRPDSSPTYVEGVPQGLVCADVGAAGAEGQRGYCCAPEVGPCAYEPLSECVVPSSCEATEQPAETCNERYYGFACRSGMRPDFLNSSLYCRNGVRNSEGLIEYCCRDLNLPIPSAVWGTACTDVTGNTSLSAADGTNLSCNPSGLTAFTCPKDDPTVLPSTDTLGASKSRADFYAPICTKNGVSTANQDVYCCYTPKLPPPGATCQGDLTVPGCSGPRFGFSCYGPDTPAEDYIPFTCPEPGVRGINQYGYEATLYCCDFTPTIDASI